MNPVKDVRGPYDNPGRAVSAARRYADSHRNCVFDGECGAGNHVHVRILENKSQRNSSKQLIRSIHFYWE